MRQTKIVNRLHSEPFSRHLSIAATMSLAILCWVGVIWVVNVIFQV